MNPQQRENDPNRSPDPQRDPTPRQQQHTKQHMPPYYPPLLLPTGMSGNVLSSLSSDGGRRRRQQHSRAEGSADAAAASSSSSSSQSSLPLPSSSSNSSSSSSLPSSPVSSSSSSALRTARRKTSSSSSAPSSSSGSSSSSSWSSSLYTDQIATSEACSEALTALLRHSSDLLPVVVESCSHPSGLDSLLLQPYSYAGGGLGNLEECPLQSCLALQFGRDGMPPYAGVCVPPACRAGDLASSDFVATLERNLPLATSAAASSSSSSSSSRASFATTTTPAVSSESQQQQHEQNELLAQEYANIFRRIGQINSFLPSGWTCGEWRYPDLDRPPGSSLSSPNLWRLPVLLLWRAYATGWLLSLAAMAVGTYRGSSWVRRRQRRLHGGTSTSKLRHQLAGAEDDADPKKEGSGSEENNNDDDETRLAAWKPNNGEEVTNKLIELETIRAWVLPRQPFGENDGGAAAAAAAAPVNNAPTTPAAATTTTTAVTETPFSSSASGGGGDDNDSFRRWTPEADDSPGTTTSPLLLSRGFSPLPASPVSRDKAAASSIEAACQREGSSTETERNRSTFRPLDNPMPASSFAAAMGSTGSSFVWSAFDVRVNHARLVEGDRGSATAQKEATACLDGIRCLSLLWIMMGHTAAIASSTGPGYTNPADVLPPHGWASSLLGQLIFASRFAVDTFLVLSGFLLVRTTWAYTTTATTIGTALSSRRNPAATMTLLLQLRRLTLMIVSRLARILPVYLACLGLFVFVAPRFWGGGVFWYQWQGLLQPCFQYGWTNLLFVNNFYPTDTSTTATCFYHSWYLAVDVQVFVLGAVLMMLYGRSRSTGLVATSMVFVALTILQAALTHDRGWSLNTFDGAAVARYDVEAYAKPHVRAPSYLAGMISAMLVIRHHHQQEKKQRLQSFRVRGTQRRAMIWGQEAEGATTTTTLIVSFCCATLAFVTFCTASGAYARRPCQYGEWPQKAGCGSLWSPRVTFLYTAFSRTLWVTAVSILLFLLCRSPDPCSGSRRRTPANAEPACDEKLDEYSTEESPPSSLLLSAIRTILSLPMWRLPSRLSFAMYLLHPIYLFVGQLGATNSKYAWRWITFLVQYSSVCAITFVSAYAVAMAVEVPCARLWKDFVARAAGVDGEGSRRPTAPSRSLAFTPGPVHHAAPPLEARIDDQPLSLPPPPASMPAHRDLTANVTSKNYGSIEAGV